MKGGLLGRESPATKSERNRQHVESCESQPRAVFERHCPWVGRDDDEGVNDVAAQRLHDVDGRRIQQLSHADDALANPAQTTRTFFMATSNWSFSQEFSASFAEDVAG